MKDGFFSAIIGALAATLFWMALLWNVPDNAYNQGVHDCQQGKLIPQSIVIQNGDTIITYMMPRH